MMRGYVVILAIYISSTNEYGNQNASCLFYPRGLIGCLLRESFLPRCQKMIIVRMMTCAQKRKAPLSALSSDSDHLCTYGTDANFVCFSIHWPYVSFVYQVPWFVMIGIIALGLAIDRFSADPFVFLASSLFSCREFLRQCRHTGSRFFFFSGL
jgi:hypothetical protein